MELALLPLSPITLSPVKRRIVYVLIFEIVAIILSTLLLMLLSGSSVQGSLPVAIAISVIAVIWNYVFNTLFEAWERRYRVSERRLKIRIVHAVGFEFGLLILTIPLYMLWYQVGLWQALVMETALLVFFLFYTFIFTWLFDLVFALPHTNKSSE
ncbi:PACE efflux transporter [Alkanindiges sp. WGS2144]|uniref:PACE efflux transporter n=1 Tax=Alkanindiges sp. WGS2144 TaxID=3366808 RepID=UPI003753DE74